MRRSYLLPLVAAASLAGLTSAHAQPFPSTLGTGFGSPYAGIKGGPCCGWREPTFFNREALLAYANAVIGSAPTAPVPVRAHAAVPPPAQRHVKQQ
jgi:hypothetical protein